MSEGIYEKDHQFALSLLCCVAGESMFMLGPPGTAKSLVARRLSDVISGGRFFDYLMSRFSTPDEIFGPVSIRKLKDEDCYERNIDGYLPTAHIVFLDEIWKAGPAIQNTLLTALNEGIFRNGANNIRLPLRLIIAASNELPRENEGLEALWDRFLVRIVSNCIEDDYNFSEMMQESEAVGVIINPDEQLTHSLLQKWDQRIPTVIIPGGILKAILYIRHELKQIVNDDNNTPLDYYISDRRWRKIAHLLRTSAFLNGRKEVDYSDLLILYHCLWNKIECVETVTGIISRSLFNDIIQACNTLTSRIATGHTGTVRNTSNKGVALSRYRTKDFFYVRLIPEIEQIKISPLYVFLKDYELMSEGKKMDGVLYSDNKLQGNVIRMLEIRSRVFSQQSANNGIINPRQVTLCKGKDTITINGQKYRLELAKDEPIQSQLSLLDVEENMSDIKNKSNDEVFTWIKRQFENRCSLVIDSDNLFLSPDDKNLVKNYKLIVKGTIDILSVRIKPGKR